MMVICVMGNDFVQNGLKLFFTCIHYSESRFKFISLLVVQGFWLILQALFDF